MPSCPKARRTGRSVLDAGSCAGVEKAHLIHKLTPASDILRSSHSHLSDDTTRRFSQTHICLSVRTLRAWHLHEPCETQERVRDKRLSKVDIMADISVCSIEVRYFTIWAEGIKLGRSGRS
jgi:hypothetical protein